MKDDFAFPIHPLLAAVLAVAALFAVLLAAYGITRSVSQDEVMGRVTVAEGHIGGMTGEQAAEVLRDIEDARLGRRATFSIEGETVMLDPAFAGLDIHEEEIVDDAMTVGRQGNSVFQFLWWLRHVFSSTNVPLLGSTDPDALTELFDLWDSSVIGEPASLGGIVVEGGTAQPVYPSVGLGVDRDEAGDLVTGALVAGLEEPVVIPTETIVPALSESDIDEAVREANKLISQPIRMVYDGEEAVFTPEQLANAYRSEIVTGGSPQVVHSFDPAVVDGYLDPIRSEFETEPVNARFVIDGDEISIAPGSKGTRIDEVETANKMLQAGLTSNRLARLPLVEGADPEFTTEYLESLAINHLVSQFTTYHDCCEARVVNIQNIADAVDQALVLPGETFSLNEHVGQRTREKGYVEAGAIIAGELVNDNIGGGTSQFATTFYNAIFWGGYEDVEHRPHSYYFSRYPEGIEATMGWRTPDLVFRNNSDSAVLVDTRHTNSSITVRLFGDNHGRTLKGEQSGGSTRVWVAAEGAPDALHVKGSVSDRFNITQPPEPVYRPNPNLGVDQVRQTQGAREGWSVTVTRRILRGGEDLVSEETWPVRYRPQFPIYEVHPCKMPGQESTCPTTTTTTTTTVPPETTTTTTEDTTSTTVP
jgi:vancomycin resistance protein YoaR